MKSQKMACVPDQPKVTQYLTPNPGKTMSVNGRNGEQEVNTKINEVSANLSRVHDAPNLLIAEINDIFENAKKKAQEKIKEAVQQGWIIDCHDQKQTDISLGVNQISLTDSTNVARKMTYDAPQEYEQADKNESDIKDIGEETIMENLKMYESYIADCIRATDLIAFFGLFTITHTKELRSIYKRNPTEATKRALDIVKTMTNQPEKYRRLLSALNDSGYTKVVQILDGTLIPVGSKHRDIIRHCAKHIYNRLNTTDILSYLYSKQIISKDDMQQIQRTERNESTGIAALELLDLLPNRNRLWYKHFVNSLKESGHKDLAKVIEDSSLQITEMTKSINRCDIFTSSKRKQEFDADNKRPVKVKQTKLPTSFSNVLSLTDETNANIKGDALGLQPGNDDIRNYFATKKKHAASKRIPSHLFSSDDPSCIYAYRHEREMGVSGLSFGEDER